MAVPKRTWSVPTSPRSPYKLPQELRLLSEFEGQKWNTETQKAFAQKLSDSDFYEGEIKNNLDFAARDRVNPSPKTFGFVQFDSEKHIHITNAGHQLIAEIGLEDLFTRQLLKWQYPSPKHNGITYATFKIKPFLELLRLVRDLDGLTKREIAIFAIPMVDYKNYNLVRSKISEYRILTSQLRGPEKRRFVLETHQREYEAIYQEELRQENLHIRQNRRREVTKESFLQTKTRSSMDYADAAIRYARATGLFKLSATTFRLQILEQKREIIEEILKTTEREPEPFNGDLVSFLNIQANPSLPLLPDDRSEILQQEIRNLLKMLSNIGAVNPETLVPYRSEHLVSASPTALKEQRKELEELLKSSAKEAQAVALRSYELFDDVISMYDKIIARGDYDIPDKPLFFEWNTWRAMTMLNDGDIISNSKMDIEGKPLNTAPGGAADGFCFYKSFALAIEVTLARGERQFEAEHESVPRHVGKLTKSLREKNDARPVFGFFIASGLNPATIAHFYSIRKTNILHYGGFAKILPMDLSDFKLLLESAKNAGGINSEQLYTFFQWADQQADISGSEVEWYQIIKNQIPTWTSNLSLGS